MASTATSAAAAIRLEWPQHSHHEVMISYYRIRLRGLRLRVRETAFLYCMPPTTVPDMTSDRRE